MPYKNIEDKRASDKARYESNGGSAGRMARQDKKCTKCDKPLWSNGLCNTHYASYRREQKPAHAKALRRRGDLRRFYGLTESDYDAMLASQNGACAICFSTEPKGKSNTFFHVDHDHVTGAVRGLLCSPCNTALGLFDDDVARLVSAAHYLRRGAP